MCLFLVNVELADGMACKFKDARWTSENSSFLTLTLPFPLFFFVNFRRLCCSMIGPFFYLNLNHLTMQFARGTAQRWVATIGLGTSLAYSTSLEEKPVIKPDPMVKAVIRDQKHVTPVALSPYKQPETKPETPLKRFTLKEFTEMSEQGRLVVGLKGFVYDVSDFSGHPGGVGRLEMASGNDLEAFW
jgi:hypothetical protein